LRKETHIPTQKKIHAGAGLNLSLIFLLEKMDDWGHLN